VPTQVFREIEFTQGEVWLVGLDKPHARFMKTPIVSRTYDDGGTYFSTDLQLFLMLPLEDASEKNEFSVQVASLSTTGTSQLMFGACSPMPIGDT
jgi:hypothetical protein